MDTLYIVMPAYNEEETILDVAEGWYPVLENGSPDSRLVIDISGSSDRTGELLQTFSETHPSLIVLDGGRTYHGPKLIRLYRYAVEQGADYVFQTDSDGQTNPLEFLTFWQLRTSYDAIFGYRRVRGDGLARKGVEVTLCRIVRRIFGVRVPDANAPFRLFKTGALAAYLPRFAPDYNLPNVMLTVWFSYYRHAIRFVEISFRPRQGGTNSIDLKKITKIGIAALRDFAAFRKNL